MSSIVLKTSDHILYQLPQGKPDPKALCSKDTLLTRAMVPQNPQKGKTCWYYALNMIRDRIGKNCTKDLEEQRAAEKEISLRRKNWTLLAGWQTQELSLLDSLKSDPYFSPYNATTKEGALNLLPVVKRIQAKATGEAKQISSELCTLLTKFTAQPEISTLDMYLNEKHSTEHNDLNLRFLHTMGADVEKMYFEWQNGSDQAAAQKEFKEMSSSDKKPALDNFTFTVAHRCYGLAVSAFRPESGSRSLHAALEAQGPMYCKGFFGKSFYAIDARIVDTVAERSIWGWHKDDPKLPFTAYHSIVVVGAKISEGASGGLVYFVDPLDGSHPDNIEQQKIYVMSYRGFTEKIANLHNKMTVDLDFKQRQFSSKVGYGLHGPRGPLTI